MADQDEKVKQSAERAAADAEEQSAPLPTPCSVTEVIVKGGCTVVIRVGTPDQLSAFPREGGDDCPDDYAPGGGPLTSEDEANLARVKRHRPDASTVELVREATRRRRSRDIERFVAEVEQGSTASDSSSGRGGTTRAQ